MKIDTMGKHLKDIEKSLDILETVYKPKDAEKFMKGFKGVTVHPLINQILSPYRGQETEG